MLFGTSDVLDKNKKMTIKVKTIDDSIKEFNVDNTYLKKITFKIDYGPLYNLSIDNVQFYIGEFSDSKEKIYGMPTEFRINEIAFLDIVKDFPKIKIIKQEEKAYGY